VERIEITERGGTMTQETVWALADKRAEQRKHDTITKIKELAGAAGISVSIHSKRGRPQKAKTDTVAGRASK